MKQELPIIDKRDVPFEIQAGKLLTEKGIHTIDQLQDLLEPNFFAVIPISILEKKTISANAKLLFAEIMALSRKSGRCYATNDYLAQRLGLSKRTIPALLKELKDDLLVKIEINRNTDGTYRDIRVSLIGNGGDSQIARWGIAKRRGQKRNRQREIDNKKNVSSSKKLFYDGLPIRKQGGKLWVAGQHPWKEYVGDGSDLTTTP